MIRGSLHVALAGVTLLASVAGGAGCSSAAGGASGGCTSVSPPGACPASPPSFGQDVEPLIATYCLQCHGPSGLAGRWDLSSYAGVKQNAVAVVQQVASCLMPNPNASPPPRAFPTEAERLTIATWAGVCGAPDN